MGINRFPRIPYDEVQSEFIREEIERGDFDDLEYRQYVNKLIAIEWYTRIGISDQATGISGLGAAIARWRLAAEYPEEFDIIRAEFGEKTLDDYRETWFSNPDDRLSTEERREKAREQKATWRKVQGSGEI